MPISSALRDAGGMPMLHAEDNGLADAGIAREHTAGGTKAIHHPRARSREVEDVAIETAIQITESTRGRTFIVHLASARGVERIATARASGLDIHTETCTHYLVFTDEVLRREDGIKWICSPPLRDEVNQAGLWRGLIDGRIAMVTSDDAAYSWAAKQLGADRFDLCPNGIPGIESRLPVMYSEGVARGRMDLDRFVETVSAAPARIFGLWPRKGNLLPGADADVVLFDPEEVWSMGQGTLHMSTDWSVFDDRPTTGRIKQVYARGERIIDGDACLGTPGRGRYLHRTLPRRI
jgi:dihydropyrimidinase